MRRAPVRAARARLRATAAREKFSRFAALVAAAWLAATLGLTGCGRHESEEPATLGFEFDSTATDTALLARGAGLLSEFEPYRASNGALRVRGRFALPDGARLQISLNTADGTVVGREQVLLLGGGFDTPPFAGGAKLPEATYQFEVSTQFNRVWQPEGVLAATRSGLSLRGPGVRRGFQGEAVYRLTIEKRL